MGCLYVWPRYGKNENNKQVIGYSSFSNWNKYINELLNIY